MTRLPLLDAMSLTKILQRGGFEVLRRRGSHIRLKHPDRRVTTIPDHPGKSVRRGLLRKILRDIGWSIGDLHQELKS